MASIQERVFTDDELREQVWRGRAHAEHCLARNKQEHYEHYETLARALEQALDERDALRKHAAPQET